MENLSSRQKFCRSVVVLIFMFLPLAAYFWVVMRENSPLKEVEHVVIAFILPVVFVLFGLNLLRRAWNVKIKNLPDLFMGTAVFTVVTIACFCPVELAIMVYVLEPLGHWRTLFFAIAPFYIVIGGLLQIFLFFTWGALTRRIFDF